jgi:pseudouridine-5'-phosphate glycosidase
MIKNHLFVHQTIANSLREKMPVVALESAVISHGLPYPQNQALALELEKTIYDEGAIPATIGMIDGEITVGLDEMKIHRLSQGPGLIKITTRDLAPAILLKWSGGTTVSSTVHISHAVGIEVFATGGIGGVHRDVPFDVSADLLELSRTPMVVVCSGAKSILDLQATVEYLETMGIPVIGFRTEDFPAFFSTCSGYKTSAVVNEIDEIAHLARIHQEAGLRSAVLVVVPPPAEVAIPMETIDAAIQQALREAKKAGVQGKSVTPFLLKRVNELTSGQSLQANLALLSNNAKVAARIAVALRKIA